ncbi:MAG: hypothetical protein K1000chlam2_01417 [Chlamydiae bacterium]|nr:hypothetical protein [Chlamydiota bacterium]
MSIPNINNNIETQPFNQSVKGFIQDLKKKVDTIVQRVLNHINLARARSFEQWFTNNRDLVSKPLTLNLPEITSIPSDIRKLCTLQQLDLNPQGD